MILASCSTSPDPSSEMNSIQLPELSELSEDRDIQTEEKALHIETERILTGMTIDEKIGQLFILAVRQTAYGKPALRMDDYLRNFMNRYNPGGIILFSINFQNPEQTRTLISDMQKESSLPLFIATDEEGGKVSRLGKQSNMNVLYLPPAQVLAARDDSLLIEKATSVLANDLRDLGFNMNMAPVADVTRNVPPDVIGSRSFGTDPLKTGEMVAAAVRGFQNNRICSVLKHFPGHGYVNGDSHNGMVKARGSLEEFKTVDFIPFRKGIDAGVDFIMSAHIQAASLTGNADPASLSYTIQTEILRKKLGFEGISITDAMDMGAISHYWSAGEAALKAFQAGIDIILMPSNIPEAQKYLKDAYINGEISESRLHESLYRIISTKVRRGFFQENYQFADRISSETKTLNHKALKTELNLTGN